MVRVRPCLDDADLAPAKDALDEKLSALSEADIQAFAEPVACDK